MNTPTIKRRFATALSTVALTSLLALTGCQAAPAPQPLSGVSSQEDLVLDSLDEGTYDLASITTKAIKKTTIQTTGNLNLRAGASKGTRLLATLKKGTKVTSTQKASNGWYKVTYKEKTGWLSGRYVKVVSTAKPATPKPKPKPATPSKTTKAKVKTSYNNSYAGLTYATYDGGVNWNKSVGIMIYLDGDFCSRGYAGAVSEHPSGSTAKAMAKVAAKRNMVMVMPRIPSKLYVGPCSRAGFTWWYKSGTAAPMIKKLDSYMRGKVGASKANTWYMGYSGGAEYITYELAKRGQGSYGYGGAILLAGGGSPRSMSTPPSSFKANFDMHWVVGTKDGFGQSVNAGGWSAYNASANGRAFFKSKGFKTTRTVLQGKGHHDYYLPSIMEIGFKAGGK